MVSLWSFAERTARAGNENSGAVTISPGNWPLPEIDELIALDSLRLRSLRCFAASASKTRIKGMMTIRTLRVEASRMNLMVRGDTGKAKRESAREKESGRGRVKKRRQQEDLPKNNLH